MSYVYDIHPDLTLTENERTAIRYHTEQRRLQMLQTASEPADTGTVVEDATKDAEAEKRLFADLMREMLENWT